MFTAIDVAGQMDALTALSPACDIAPDRGRSVHDQSGSQEAQDPLILMTRMTGSRPILGKAGSCRSGPKFGALRYPLEEFEICGRTIDHGIGKNRIQLM